MKGAKRARRKAAASASNGRTEGISLEGRGREILLRHEGLAPVRSQRLETGSGSFQTDVFLPDIGSIALSFSAGPGPGLLIRDPPWKPRFPFRAMRLAAVESGGNGAASVSQRRNPRSKRRQPFTCFMNLENGNEDKKDRRTTLRRTRNAYSHAAPKSRNRLQKNVAGGRRKSLKRLDSAKEM
jgi:hypothetical protein